MNQGERDIRVFSGMPSRLATLQDLPVLLHRPGELLSQESSSPTARRASLANRKPAPRNPANRTPLEIVEKVLHLRRTYHLSPLRIVWYLAHLSRYQNLGCRRLSHSQVPRLEQASAGHASSQNPHPAPWRYFVNRSRSTSSS